MEELNKLDTEQRNPATANIDRLPTEEMVRLINQEDHRCAEAVALVLPEIARSVALIDLCRRTKASNSAMFRSKSFWLKVPLCIGMTGF